MEAEKLLEALDPDQRQVALQSTGPLCVRAGAGTGKTRAITYRIAYAVARGIYPPAQVMAVTFTTKAAQEMDMRLRALGVFGASTRTFHSAALRQLSYFWPHAVGGRLPQVISYKAPLIYAACARLGIEADKELVRDLSSEVEWSKVSMVAPENYEDAVGHLGRALPGDLSVAQMVDLLRTYEVVKGERDCIDFEDILLLNLGLLIERDDIATQIRQSYRHFVVDEYQDVSPLQHALLQQWLGGRHDICVVGDAAQTIYSFAGASARYLAQFPKEHPGANIVQLNRDYRSTPQIVSVANLVVSKLRGKDMEGKVKLVAQQPSGPAVDFHTYASDQKEAQATVQQIQQLLQSGYEPKQIAILYRVNSQSEEFIQELSGHSIAYQLKEGTRIFDRDDVRRAMGLLRTEAKANPGQDALEMMQNIVSTLGWTPQAPATSGAGRERWNALNYLVEVAKEYHEEKDLAELYLFLEQHASKQSAPQTNGITLSTIHAAKGLEWEAVFLVGLSEGLLPISQAKDKDALEEERRLLYVGITRARTYLTMSWARSRSGRSASRKCSRFVSGIFPPEFNPKKAPDPQTLNSADSALFEVLKQWRLLVSKGLQRPAFTVLTDVTLKAVARHRPQNAGELAKLPGLGNTKIYQFGRSLLGLVQGKDPEKMAQQTIRHLSQ